VRGYLDADLPPLLPTQESRVATVEVTFEDRTENVPIALTWEDYLDKRGLYHTRRLRFHDLATEQPFIFEEGKTLEAMGYRGGKLAVGYR
jgi:hypothetical protein